ncbi:hypothetical protein QCA50_000537 [Cerrena zonata]|uniref:Uncharacterized protein n=1 Tax=Cerrena zonata TaxID=2478898 RepID=A0AAW0GY40_9APHY
MLHHNRTISSKDSEINTLRDDGQKILALEATLQAREDCIAQLEPLTDQLADISTKLNASETKLSVAKADLLAKQQIIQDLQTKLSALEAGGDEKSNELRQIQEQVGASSVTVEWLKDENKNLRLERETMTEKNSQLSNELSDLRKELETRTEKLHEAQTQYQVRLPSSSSSLLSNVHQIMEERFQDQSVTLRLTKESLGDMQDRMIDSETKLARELEVTSAALKCDIAVLTTQSSSLCEKVSNLKDVLQEKEDELRNARLSHDEVLKQQESASRSSLDAANQAISQLERDLLEARLQREQLQEKLDATDACLQTVEAQLEEAQEIPVAHQEEIAKLKEQFIERDREVSRLDARAKTIAARYKAGDLSEVEKTFTNSLIQMSQSIHEQELIAKGNELRRRDNTVAELRARINLLEATLAKHLKSQAKLQGVPGIGNRSLIDPATWTSSSEHSSSPLVPPPGGGIQQSTIGDQLHKAAQQSRLTTPRIAAIQGNRTPAISRTPAPFRTPAPVPVAPRTPAATSSSRPAEKPKFSRLARVCSDEIEDFEPPVTLSSSSPLKSGKRDKAERPPTPTEAESPARPAKRLRASNRSKADGKGNSQNITNKVVETAPKTRARRKR